MIDRQLENRLQQTEYVLLTYRLEFVEDVSLPEYALLRLRREFWRLLKSPSPVASELSDCRELLQPPLPDDPGLVRRVQQPSPGFVLRPDQLRPRRFATGEVLELPVAFIGQAIQQIASFSGMLRTLGEIGICSREGRFKLVTITNSLDPEPAPLLWTSGPFSFAPRIHDFSDGLAILPRSQVRLEFQTPARLLTNGRPLFRPAFAALFPFILRRVTGVLAAWAQLEELFDISVLLERSGRIEVVENRLVWQDWRPLHGRDEVGGIFGSLTLGGEGLTDLWPLLKIAELLGIGKGAAFGAGRYRLG